MNINPFLFNSIINAKAKHLGRNHQFIYCQLPDGKTIKAYALTHVSSANVNVVKFEGNYYCFCGSAPVELSRSTKQLGVRVRQQKKEQSLLFLLIDITKSLENDGILQAINYINTHNYQSYQYLSFGDTTGYISEPLSKTNILTELQDYYDNYNPNYDDDFYCSEGTDLPENGIDALNDAILSFDNKYLVDLYLVTDNSKYSRNTSDPEDILDLIDNKINKLFIDIIEPKNVPSEHIVIEGQEQNPYCTNSAITTVLVNDVKIGNYQSNSNILIENIINPSYRKIQWNSGEHILESLTSSYQVILTPKRNSSFQINTTVKKLAGDTVTRTFEGTVGSYGISSFYIGLMGFGGYLDSEYLYYQNSNYWEATKLEDDLYAVYWLMSPDPIQGYVTLPTIINPIDNDYGNINSNTKITINEIVATEWELYIEEYVAWWKINKTYYNYTPSIIEFIPYPQFESIIDPSYFQFRKIINPPNTTETIINTHLHYLKINGNTIQSLQETDVVKAVCQPQIVPLTEPNSTLYTTSLPPSNKIIYLD